jgi:hypothetical protein
MQVEWELALFQLAVSGSRQGHIGYKIRIEQSENNGFLFPKTGNLCWFYPILTTYLQIQ